MGVDKKLQDATRLKYARLLDRFHKSITSYLSLSDHPTKETYDKKVQTNLAHLSKVTDVELYKSDLKELESFIKKMISYKDSDTPIEDIKDDILYTSNRLQKSQNAKKYKKAKYSKYDEWE
ncbi:MAG: hypothetical protein WC144_06370 [Sulfurimonas sp.]|jgi:hypothetical protein|nr:hypothetical protein [Sulfurimonadaceae bacterium]